MTKKGPPRIEALKVKNYRALKDLELDGLRPFSVLLGPNGSGKSTVFDVFAFLSECFRVGLRKAWDKRGRFKELRSRGADGPIVFELKYREAPNEPVITYHLAIDEKDSSPIVAEESLQWKRGPSSGRPFRFLDFKNGSGKVISGEMPGIKDDRLEEKLDSPEMLAASSLGQFAKHTRVSALRRFIIGWHLSQTGDNRPNVIPYLRERQLRANPPMFIGIEEPESHLHPKLQQSLVEECREASGQTQLLVSTHSPLFVNDVKADELWALSRDERGYTRALRADSIRGIPGFMENGALLGQLWMEGRFDMDAFQTA